MRSKHNNVIILIERIKNPLKVYEKFVSSLLNQVIDQKIKVDYKHYDEFTVCTIGTKKSFDIHDEQLFINAFHLNNIGTKGSCNDKQYQYVY
jgi:hypothetical protein